MFEGIDVYLLHKKNAIFCDYMENFSRLKDFYPHHYSEKKFRRTQPVVPRVSLCERLSSYNKKIGASQKTLENIERLHDENAFAVVSGQQPGLFCGPLYTIYKALSVATLAEENDFVPLFWNASEDADFEEVNHTAFLSKEGIVELSTKIEGGGRPISDVPLDVEEVKNLLSSFSSAAPETEFRGELLSAIEDAASHSDNYAEFFSRLMAWLFGEYGLIIVEPRILRDVSLPLLEKILENPTSISHMVEEEGRKLELLGYEPQIVKKKDATNLYYVKGRRYPLLFFDDRFHAGDKTFSKGEMLDMLRRDPNSFSVSVVLRPVIQDYLLPTAAYIAGPSEVAYFAQLPPVYKHLGVNQPLLYPRSSVTIVEANVKRTMEKYGVDLLSLANPGQVIDGRVRETVDASFRQFYEETDALFEKIKRNTPVSLEKSVEATRASVKNNILSLQKKVQSERKREDELFVSQIEKASLMLFPRGEMQERVLGFMGYYNKYGKNFLQQIYETIKSTTPDKHIIFYR